MQRFPKLRIASVELIGQEVQLHEQAAPFRGATRGSDAYRLQYRPLEDALYARLEERFGLATSPSVQDAEALDTFLQKTFNTSLCEVLQRWFSNFTVRLNGCNSGVRGMRERSCSCMWRAAGLPKRVSWLQKVKATHRTHRCSSPDVAQTRLCTHLPVS